MADADGRRTQDGTARPEVDPGGPRSSLLATLTLLVSLMATLALDRGVVWTLVVCALAVAVAATTGVVAVRALLRTHGPGRTAPGALPALIVSGGSALLVLLLAAGTVLLGSTIDRLVDCNDLAITTSTRDACADAAQQEVEDRLVGDLQP